MKERFSVPTNQAGKGSKSRVTNAAKYRQEYDSIRWTPKTKQTGKFKKVYA